MIIVASKDKGNLGNGGDNVLGKQEGKRGVEEEWQKNVVIGKKGNIEEKEISWKKEVWKGNH